MRSRLLGDKTRQRYYTRMEKPYPRMLGAARAISFGASGSLRDLKERNYFDVQDMQDSMRHHKSHNEN